jgi:N-acetylmuramoyl-L-alanine amidase
LILSLMIMVGLMTVAGDVFAAGALVSDVRVGQHGERTRIVLELDSAIKFDVFTLPEPYRVVLNLPEVDWTIDPHALPENKGLLERMRYGLFTPGTSRMVLDVKGPVDVHKSFLLKPIEGKHWRLVLDLGPTSETEFLEALAAKRAKDRTDLAALIASSSQTTEMASANTSPQPPSASSPSPMHLQSQLRVPPIPPRRPAIPGKHVIAIDPGHGGIDPGTIGYGKTYEKNVTLALGLDLKKALEATGRYRVVMTRDRDIFHRLRDRVSIARDAGAELFISVHADSVANPKTRGLSIYTLSETASDKEAGKLAAKENKSDLIAGIDLSTESMDVTNILLDLAQRETMNQSAMVAKDIVKELRREIQLLRNTHRFAGFAVLKAPDMPSVLVEAGFLSNRQDERNLLNKKYRKGLADAITRGVDQHFSGVEEARLR